MKKLLALTALIVFVLGGLLSMALGFWIFYRTLGTPYFPAGVLLTLVGAVMASPLLGLWEDR